MVSRGSLHAEMCLPSPLLSCMSDPFKHSSCSPWRWVDRISPQTGHGAPSCPHTYPVTATHPGQCARHPATAAAVPVPRASVQTHPEGGGSIATASSHSSIHSVSLSVQAADDKDPSPSLCWPITTHPGPSPGRGAHLSPQRRERVRPQKICLPPSLSPRTLPEGARLPGGSACPPLGGQLLVGRQQLPWMMGCGGGPAALPQGPSCPLPQIPLGQHVTSTKPSWTPPAAGPPCPI